MSAFVMTMFVTHRAHSAVPYLPSVGPAPLRFELVLPPGELVTWKPLLLPAKKPEEEKTNAPASAPETLAKATDATNAVSTDVVSVSSTNTSPDTNSTTTSIPALADVSAEPTNDETPKVIATLPAQPEDLSGPVTPQILTEFFRPGPGGRNQNGTVAFVPAEIGFTPPTPKTTHESKATYKIE